MAKGTNIIIACGLDQGILRRFAFQNDSFEAKPRRVDSGRSCGEGLGVRSRGIQLLIPNTSILTKSRLVGRQYHSPGG